MKKQQIFAYACSAALLGTLIGCGQKTEIDQSVPDTIIEVAKTTASSETASVTSETSGITSSSTGSATSSGSTNTTTATTIHYAGNPNLTVRRTEAPATQLHKLLLQFQRKLQQNLLQKLRQRQPQSLKQLLSAHWLHQMELLRKTTCGLRLTEFP